MSEHLTQNQIEVFVQRTLSGADLLSLFDHMDNCESCRQRIENALGGDSTFLAVRSQVFGADAEVAPPAATTHLTFDHLAEYIDGLLTGEQLQKAKDHLASCGRCFLEVNDLRAFRSEVAPSLDRNYGPEPAHTKADSWWHHLVGFLPYSLQKPPALVFSSAVVVLLLMGTGWLVWQRLERRETTTQLAAATPSPNSTPTVTTGVIPTASPTVEPEETTALVVAQLNDGQGRVTLDQEGKLSGVDYLPPSYQRMLKESLTNQRVEKSELLAGLNRPASPLMGGSDPANKFSVIAPAGKVLQSNRPTFRWSQLQGATAYVVEIYDEKFNLVANSPAVTDNSWTSPPLKRGDIYSWQVKALKDGQEFKAPRPPAAQAKFRILDSTRMNELEQARRAYPSSHLVLGLLCAQSGLLDEAEKEFRALQKANPDSVVARRLLRQIRNLRR